MSFPLGTVARAADTAHQVRFGQERWPRERFAAGPLLEFYFTCSARGCARTIGAILARSEDSGIGYSDALGMEVLGLLGMSRLRVDVCGA